MVDQLPGSPVPNESDIAGLHPEPAYDRLLAAGVLGFQACSACRGAVFPPRTICPHCGSVDLSWRRAAGDGTVYSATMISPRDQEPYCVALVDVAEGYRMMTNVVGTPSDDVRIGASVRVRIERRDDQDLPLFEVVTR